MSSDPALTTESHHCGARLYRVGSDGVLFCPSCRVQPRKEDTDSSTEPAENVEDIE